MAADDEIQSTNSPPTSLSDQYTYKVITARGMERGSYGISAYAEALAGLQQQAKELGAVIIENVYVVRTDKYTELSGMAKIPKSV